jgi:ribosomal protein S18 acetylase RimI-like enzyme
MYVRCIMHFTVRYYTKTDWNQVREIILNAENFGADFIKSEKLRIDTFLKSPKYGKVIVIEEPATKTILGYAAISFQWRALVIETIITHHNYLRKGIGTQIIDWIKHIGLEDPDVDVIRVDTGDFMQYVQKFYLSCGFTNSGFVKHYLSWHNDQVFFTYQVKKEPS